MCRFDFQRIFGIAIIKLQVIHLFSVLVVALNWSWFYFSWITLAAAITVLFQTVAFGISQYRSPAFRSRGSNRLLQSWVAHDLQVPHPQIVLESILLPPPKGDSQYHMGWLRYGNCATRMALLLASTQGFTMWSRMVIHIHDWQNYVWRKIYLSSSTHQATRLDDLFCLGSCL